jgi:hypothetical protein
MKIGLNPELIVQGSGPAGCYGIYRKKETDKKIFFKCRFEKIVLMYMFWLFTVNGVVIFPVFKF